VINISLRIISDNIFLKIFLVKNKSLKIVIKDPNKVLNMI